MGEAVYTPLGDGRFEPGELSRGPWSPDHQHGGAPAALLAGAIEATGEPSPMRVARLTLNLLRPVPIAPLQVATEVVRPGRRVQVVAASLSCDGEEVVRAQALKIRSAPGESERQGFDPPPEPGPQEAPEPVEFDAGLLGGPMFGGAAMEIRLSAGKERWETPGPSMAWTRLLVEIVAGEEPSPLQRAVATADFANGTSSVLDWKEHAFINPDLTVVLGREPRGEWIGLDAVSSISDDGSGMATGTLFDADGRFGVSAQALYVSGIER
ncbi:MAG: thioesterase family protein [Acidobacteria bacterium]|nr:thioesterase family protein [Acidobacteriota bacterium]